MTEPVRRNPIGIQAQPSDIEGFTTDVYINGYRCFSVALDSLTEQGLLKVVAETLQIGATLLLEDMGKTVNDTSDAEH